MNADVEDNESGSTVYKRRLEQKNAEIVALQERIRQLAKELATSLQQQQKDKRSNRRAVLHAYHVREVSSSNRSSNKRTILTTQRERLGRNASITTQRVLQQSAATNTSSSNDDTETPPTIQRILDMFQRPTHHLEYLKSEQFAKDILKVANRVRHTLEREPRVVFIQSPCYVFGDIHGNLEDLHFFSDNLWRLGMSLTAGNFLFLGDYVDRGLSCLETVAYLLAMKQQLPNKVFLLRGNHETRDVNGWEEHYGERSFIWQCRNRFGDDTGYRVWEACNQVFDRLPLAAVIDQDIFCVHGGIPRPISQSTTRIQDILAVPKVAGINPPYEHEDDLYQQVASDCIWSDPASEEQEMTTVDPVTGYGESLRGGGAICFGNKAVTDFLAQHDFSYIMRAHEAHAEGVAVCKGARVFTVFSTSKDHNQGSHALAGCMLVDNDKLQVINRSPAYKNQYVHRRDSVSLANLSEQEIQKRIKLGLVTVPPNDASEDEDLDEWDDITDNNDEEDEDKEANDDEESYVFDHRRRSSVDLSSMSDNSHDEWDSDAGSNGADNYDPNKRHRSKRQPGISPIKEEETEDVEIQDAIS